MRIINDFAMMAPMKYYDNPEPNTDGAIQKRQDMIENKDNLYIATEKHDGDWGMFIHYSKGNNLIRSRSISKITGVYGDYTAKLPHLCSEMDTWPDNTVVLAEICWDEYGTNANTVGTILRCLPEKAVERQKTKKLSALVFDVLMYDNMDITNLGYIYRLGFVMDFNKINGVYFKPTKIFTDDFAAAADAIISAGGEGCVIQRKDNPYMPGTRTAWKTLKLKQCLPHMELQVVGILDPEVKYKGDFIDTWKYWVYNNNHIAFEKKNQDYRELLTYATPITKYCFYGWKRGVVVRLPSGITTEVTGGLHDEDAAWLSTTEAQAKIAAGELWAEVKAMSINDLGKLRHPALVRLRTDLNSKGE